MAFLAIPLQAPGGDDPNADDTFNIISSLAETSALVSCLFSMASLIAALNLRRDFGGKIMRDTLQLWYVTSIAAHGSVPNITAQASYLVGVQKRLWVSVTCYVNR